MDGTQIQSSSLTEVGSEDVFITNQDLERGDQNKNEKLDQNQNEIDDLKGNNKRTIKMIEDEEDELEKNVLQENQNKTSQQEGDNQIELENNLNYPQVENELLTVSEPNKAELNQCEQEGGYHEDKEENKFDYVEQQKYQEEQERGLISQIKQKLNKDSTEKDESDYNIDQEIKKDELQMDDYIDSEDLESESQYEQYPKALKFDGKSEDDGYDDIDIEDDDDDYEDYEEQDDDKLLIKDKSNDNVTNKQQISFEYADVELIVERLAIDGYTDLTVLFQGRYGVLMKVNSTKLQKPVVLKISKKSKLDYDYIFNEYQILSRLQANYVVSKDSYYNHNIVKIIEFLDYKELNTCIIVQEYCLKNLELEIKEIKDKNCNYTWEESNTIIIHLINAITHIHSNRVIHFDIKSCNVLKTDNGIYKLCDFDLSHTLDKHQESTQVMKGYTKRYMSPEQEKWVNEKQLIYKPELSQKSDVFNLGIVFLELLGLKIPKKRAILIRNGRYVFPQWVRELQWFQKIQLMLKINPEERIESSQLFSFLYPLYSFREKNETVLKQIYEEISNSQYISCNINVNYRIHSNAHLIVALAGVLNDSRSGDYFQVAKLFKSGAELYCLLGEFKNSVKYAVMSLEAQELHQFMNPTEQIDNVIYAHLFASDCFYLDMQIANAQKHSQIAYNLMEQHNCKQNSQFVGKVLSYKSRLERLNRNYSEAINFGQMGLNLLRGEKSETLIFCYEQIALAYDDLNQIPQSIQLRKEELVIAQEIYLPNDPNIARLIHNLGNSYFRLNEIQESLNHYQKAYKMFLQIYGSEHLETNSSFYGIQHCQSALKNKETQVFMQPIQLPYVNSKMYNQKWK